MTPFLQQVAKHFFALGRVEHLCFIFPNRRAMSFFCHYLSMEVAASGRPIVAPPMFTIGDFFSRMADETPADKVHLLLKLYDCYRKLNPKAESLDDFIFWGDVLLSDFDDIDKYLVDARQVLANVSEFKAIRDGYSYLEPGQKEAIERFLSHFHNGKELTVDPDTDTPNVKERFVHIWNLLHPLYLDFRESLSAEGLAYEGQIYRSLAEKLDGTAVSDMTASGFPDTDAFVFVGLNALNECEKKLLSKMRDASLAQFCWDFSSDMIRNTDNKASFFMASNVEAWPQAFEIDAEPLPQTVFNVVSVPSSTGCAKQIPEILSRLSPDLSSVGMETAIVLPDEGLLLPVLNSIPSEISEVNVTMGYPLKESEIWSLFNEISDLQLHLRKRGDKWYFYHRQVWSIFSNSLVRQTLSERGREIVAAVKKDARYYVCEDDFRGDAVLERIFVPVVQDPLSVSVDAVRKIGDYQQNVISTVASALKGGGYEALELDFARELWLAVGRLKTYGLEMLPSTYFRLLSRLVEGSAVPFEGEPLKGLQIMGPLETRALDFDNIVLLGCNEGLFPRRSVSSSFIPPELRKGFHLPTYEYQDAVWAYYFYRMIQRASNVWMLFDSRTEVSKSGEESRYIKQLELHFGVKVNRHVVKSDIRTGVVAGDIPKTVEDVESIRAGHLSASAMQSYLTCPAKFYYSFVKRLKTEEDVAESLDAGMTGNVYHDTMKSLYQDRPAVSVSYIRSILSSEARIREEVARRICDQLHAFEVAGRNILYEDMVTRYVVKTLQRDLELLEKVYRTDSFRILGVETERFLEIGGFRFKGRLDRLDSFAEGEVRVVDYKTGKVLDEDINVTDDNAEAVVSALFADDNDKRPKIALQLYLYDEFVKNDREVSGCRIVNSIYQTGQLFVSPVKSVPLSPRFQELAGEALREKLKELSDISVPFRRCSGGKACEWCDFKSICGR